MGAAHAEPVATVSGPRQLFLALLFLKMPLEQLEAGNASDPLTVEKLARIDQALGQQERRIDEIILKSRCPILGGSHEEKVQVPPAHKAAFEGYVRKGDAHPLVKLESKALSVGSEADGGYLVPTETERTINRKLQGFAVKAPYRTNARFAMSRVTQSVVRKMKDGQGNYLWQPSAIAGTPSTLLGFPVTEAEEMPDIAAASMSIAFGDFKRGYLVVDRTGIRVLRDHYSMKPYVLFYTTKRVQQFSF